MNFVHELAECIVVNILIPKVSILVALFIPRTICLMRSVIQTMPNSAAESLTLCSCADLPYLSIS